MKVWFDTVGCLKNFDDSDMAMGILEEHGHSIASDPDDADVIVVNTCGFIEDAKRESIDEILSVADYRAQGKKIIVTGCLAQRYSKELFDEFSEVDGFLGVNDYEKLPELIDTLSSGSRFVNNADYDKEKDPYSQGTVRRHIAKGTYSTYIKIAEGCDRSCSYCVIPKIRGPFRSKPKELVLEEARGLAKNGCKELTVIAEDTGSYGIDLFGKPMLHDLLKSLCEVDGIEWIRLMYCYEDHITNDLVKVMKEEDKICNYIDIPLQHASDRILKLMRRKTTRKEITEKIKMLRDEIPDIAIRTTFITGFPGETDEDVDELIDFVEEQRFTRLGVFAFSREEGTEAYDLPDQLDQKTKDERRDAVMLRQLDISLEHNREMIGKTFDVIVDAVEEDGSYTGRTRYDAPDIDNSVIFTSDNVLEPGDIVKVRIDDAFDYDVKGMEVKG